MSVCLHVAKKQSPFDLVPAAKVLPPILFAFLPPFSRRRDAALSRGAAVTLHLASEASAVRGMLALLLRSVAATEADLNYMSLATHPSCRYDSTCMVVKVATAALPPCTAALQASHEFVSVAGFTPLKLTPF